MSKQPPPAIGPCPTIIQIVGHPSTGSLPRTIAPPDLPPNGNKQLPSRVTVRRIGVSPLPIKGSKNWFNNVICLYLVEKN